jgi:microsomal epoxide hydrolase
MPALPVSRFAIILALVLTAALAATPARAGNVLEAAGAFRGGFVTVADGVRLHYVEGGAGRDAPTLLFIPGWTMDVGVWQAQMQRFARDYRVLAIDPRSQGESSKTPDGNTPEQRARDLDALLQKLELNRVVLIGWSQAVQDVAAYVSRFGTAKLAGAVLVDASVSAGPDFVTLHPQAAKATLGRVAIYAAQPRAYLQGMMQAIFRKPLAPDEMEQMVDRSLRTPTSTGIAMLVLDLFAVDRRPALAKFDMPTLIIAAGTSPELADQQAEAGQMPDARAVVIQDAGHAVFHDRPEAFERVLRDFLAALPRRPAN